jgi:hypothetical protein
MTVVGQGSAAPVAGNPTKTTRCDACRRSARLLPGQTTRARCAGVVPVEWGTSMRRGGGRDA